jgi:putative ABC transport system substrate-binding protein
MRRHKPEGDMQRREFIALLGGAAAAWPLAAHAQQPMPVIGFLHSASPAPFTPFVGAFRRALAETGYVEGRSVGIEYRWAEGQYDRLPAMAADLVGRQVAVIVSAGGIVSALAAKAATSTTPIIFSSGEDPLAAGLVTSLNRPGGNATGIYLFIGGLDPKKLGLLSELVPQAQLIAALYNPTRAETRERELSTQEAARAIGRKTHTLYASTESEIDAAFATVTEIKAGALIVGADAFLNSRRDQIVALAARHAIPAIYEGRAFVEAGGLMSYGTSLMDGYRQIGIYTGRVLKGDRPADLPVVQSVKFEFVMNFKTAKALGLEVPLKLHQLADEVIE